MAEKKRELDKAQEKAVDVKINAVVSAGAGSGKTTVLARRFIDLLKRDSECNVDQILTLTFTKKATTEMTGRIYKELHSELPKKTSDFYKANIMTLDSYCSKIARMGCRNFGISPDFSVGDESLEAKVHSLALPFILKYRDNEGINYFVDTKNYESIAKELFSNVILNYSTIAENINFKEMYESQKKEVVKIWNEECKKITGLVDSIRNCLYEFNGNSGAKYILRMKEACSKELPEIPLAEFENLESNREDFILAIEKITRVRQTGRLNGAEEIKQIHNEIRDSYEIIIQLENYIYGSYYVNKLIPLLEEFQEKVNEIKRSTGLLTFADATSLAKVTLRDYPEIRLIEKQKYKYIMIDEFQDNNSLQRDLLFLISEKTERKEKSIPSVDDLLEEKLFFVGDEKQSIYRFRGADVSVFRGLSKDFEKGNLELQTNYRSCPSLVAAFNTIFGGAKFMVPKTEEENGKQEICLSSVFYTEKDLQNEIPNYEAIYHNVKNRLLEKEIESEIVNGLPKKRLHIALLDKNKEQEDDELDEDFSEAVWVSNKINELVTSQKYKYSDIAILFRSYSQLPIYEKVFLAKGIPYNSEAIKGFYSDGPVNDIMSFLRLVAYPKDMLSFVNILRSPFLNLSFEETNYLLSKITGKEDALFDCNVDDVLINASKIRYANLQRIYKELCYMATKDSLTKLVSFLWYELGYRYETLWNKNVWMYSSFYDRIFELARKADVSSMGLADFVDNLDNYQNDGEKLDGMEIPMETSEGVNILSIHKSKGLEYPVVFLCAIGHRGQRNSNSSVAYYSKEFGMTFNTFNPKLSSAKNYFFEKQRSLFVDMGVAELRRLVYVAVTRAEKEMYISGFYKFNNILGEDYSVKGDKTPETIIQILLSSINQFFSFNKDENNPDSYSLELIDNQKSMAPFDFEEILYQKKESIEMKKISKKNKVKKISPYYQDVSVIEEEVVEDNHISPSHLHDEESIEYNFEEVVVEQDIPYFEIDQIVASTKNEKGNSYNFNSANFGTIIHNYLESEIRGEKPSILNREIVGLKGSEQKLKELTAICEKMRKAFVNTEIYKQAVNAREKNLLCKSEYSFLSLEDGNIINGQMDLVYEKEDGSYVLVDYKSDKKINPEKHRLQLECYRRNLSKMFDIPEEKIKCLLYYLRYNKVVEL